MKSLFGFLAALCLALLIAAATVRPPAPLLDDAPGSVFSAERAMADVRRIGQVPHPTGSPENRQVRDALIRRMQDLGLEVTTQRADAIHGRWPGYVAGGRVESLIGVLPGQDRNAAAVVLMSHYDSAVGSPGAADDAAGVAASLETVRALLAENAPRRRDLIVLITDGEEQGLLGANAFFAQHPLRERVGAVVNLETRGAAGRAFMFETGRMNGAMMGLYARAVSRPSTTSLAAFLYSILPNDTDFSHPRDHGIAGFNLAFIDEPFHYHSATATPNALDQGSLQHLGGQALDLTRALLSVETLPAPRPNAVFSDLFGLFTVVYPAWVGWILLAVAGLVLLGLGLRSEPRGQTLRVAGVGLAAGLVMTAACGLLGYGLLLLTGSPTDFVMNRPLLGRLGLFEIAMIAASFAAAILVGRLMLRSRPGLYRPHEAPAIGLLTFGWLLALTLQITAPEAAIVATWPTLVGSIALLTARRLGGWAWPVAVTLGVVGAAWILGVIHGVFLGVGATQPFAPAALSVLVLVALAPMLVDAVRPRAAITVGLIALTVAAALGLWLRLAPAGTPEHPAPTQVFYVVDSTAGTARLAAPPLMRDRWTQHVLSSQGSPIVDGDIPALAATAWRTAEAATVGATAPRIDVSSLADGRLRIAAADLDARELRLTIQSDQPLSDITVMGRPVLASAPGAPLVIRWADPSQGVAVSFRSPSSAVLYWAAFHDGWPQDAPPLARREPDLAPFGPSDSLVVIGETPLTPPG